MPTKQPIDIHKSSDDEFKLDKFFRTAMKFQASDLHLKVGQPPKLRIKGQLKSTTGEIMTREAIEAMVFEIMDPEQKKLFVKSGAIDFAREIGSEERFRLNIFYQRGMISVSARRVDVNIPSLESLHLPSILEKISNNNQGLVLLVGPTGCGKSTTAASMINYINKTRPCHIVTIEDPIEHLFKDEKAIISQREVGIDVEGFEQAMKFLMRQDPDVVFVGEMRDDKTVAAALRAAETGHLVFGTMHSANSSQAVQRLLEMFPQNKRELARQTLSLVIQAIISQVLLPSIKKDIDRIPAVEILLGNPGVRKLISEQREADLPCVIRSCREEGMLDFTASLCELVKNEFVEPKEAYKYAPNADELVMALKGLKIASGGIL